ncbi:uncharacterized protein [Choristoneura fumiferana]|uniref:uncharacterized protein n=1 Tax=Choristoneura fumiferana TaxID=7141 RepID=UPI003D15530B
MTVKPKLNMKTIALFVLVALAAAVSADGDYAPYDLRQAPALFSKFEKDYDREYKDAVDRKVHFEAFKKFLREVNEAARHQPTAKMGITQFADYTDEEKKQALGFGPI